MDLQRSRHEQNLQYIIRFGLHAPYLSHPPKRHSEFVLQARIQFQDPAVAALGGASKVKTNVTYI